MIYLCDGYSLCNESLSVSDWNGSSQQTLNFFGSGVPCAHLNITGSRRGSFAAFFLTSLGNAKAFVSFLMYLPFNVSVDLTEVFAD